MVDEVAKDPAADGVEVTINGERREIPEGLTVHEIVQRIHAAGLRDPAATRSPEQTLFRDLREATRPGRDGPFRRTSVKPLCYGLHDVTPRAG